MSMLSLARKPARVLRRPFRVTIHLVDHVNHVVCQGPFYPKLKLVADGARDLQDAVSYGIVLKFGILSSPGQPTLLRSILWSSIPLLMKLPALTA